MDFIGCAFNQIVNMAAKAHYRWGAPAQLRRAVPAAETCMAGPSTRKTLRCGSRTPPD